MMWNGFNRSQAPTLARSPSEGDPRWHFAETGRRVSGLVLSYFVAGGNNPPSSLIKTHQLFFAEGDHAYFPQNASGFLCLVGLSALALLVLSVVPVHGQDVAAPAPTLTRKDLLNCELAL